jgi:Ca-activated chloride channel family protein
VNVALVLDRSGSMSGRPLELAVRGASLAVGALRPDDRMALVAYDARVDVLLRSTRATPEAKRRAGGLLAAVRSGGSTDLHGGWLQGCEEIAAALDPEAESRCLLLTDGHANQGVKDASEIARHADGMRTRGIVTSTFGLGDDFDEVLLKRMSEAGGGNAYWVREPEQVGPAMEAELGDSLEVVARGVELVVEGVGVEEVLVPGLGRLPRGVDGRYRRPLGNLAAGQVRSEALHVRLRRRRPGRQSAVKVWLEDAEGVLPRGETDLAWSFQPREVAREAAFDSDVVVATRTAFVHGLIVEALSGDRLREAAQWIERLDREAARLASLATRVPSLAPVVDDLRKAAGELADQEFLADARAVKAAYYRADYALKGRDDAGRARKGAGVMPLYVDLVGDGIDLAEVAWLLDRRFRDAVRGRSHVRVQWVESRPASGPETAPLTRADIEAMFPAPDPDDFPRLWAMLCLTRRPLRKHRFSEWLPDRRGAVVSLDGLDAATRAPLPAFLAYETLLHGLRSFGDAWDPDLLMHEETRGCVFDLCRVRSDIDVKLHAASLCGSCRERLRHARIDTGFVDACLSVVRDLSAAARVGVN